MNGTITCFCEFINDLLVFVISLVLFGFVLLQYVQLFLLVAIIVLSNFCTVYLVLLYVVTPARKNTLENCMKG